MYASCVQVFGSLKIRSRVNNIFIQDLASYLVYDSKCAVLYEYSRKVGVSETKLYIVGLVGETIKQIV
jgi:hypothetical protein